MNSTERKSSILNKLKESITPIKGTDLAKLFNVSRQIIVQDIALLRAQGEDIISTPQGYMVPFKRDDRITKRIVCKHEGYNAIGDELQVMLDYGARILDVIVEHPLYGEITSQLNINNKIELEDFINNITKKKAEPLASLTEGIHIHTIEISNERIFQELKKALNEKGYLIND